MDDTLQPTQEKMEKTIEALKREFAAIRAGRANPAVLDKIRVDYYGTPTPINQMAAVAVAEARILTIQPWDAGTVRAIEKALQASDLGINPQSDGRLIRLIFPQLTEDDLKVEEKALQELTDKFVKEIDRVAAAKDKEIMEI